VLSGLAAADLFVLSSVERISGSRVCVITAQEMVRCMSAVFVVELI
jgi:hypothetical protein